jgi:hypothetical protein
MAACGDQRALAPGETELGATSPAGAGASPNASGSPKTCDELAAGGVPEALTSFLWEWDPGCGPNACSTSLSIERGCNLRIQRQTPGKADGATAEMADAECRAARAWVTNALFLQVLRDGTGCEMGKLAESFAVTLGGGTTSRKTWDCSEPTVALARSCLQGLVDRHFPP